MENGDIEPGQTITPQTAAAPAPPSPAAPLPAAVAVPAQPVPSVPAAVPTGLERPEEAGEQTDPNEISWTASEFIAHEKSVVWYVALALIMLAIVALIYVATHDIMSVVVVVFVSIILGVYAARQPRQVEFRVDSHGLRVGQRHYSYNEFRSFAIVPEGAFSSIVLMPLKRFATITTIYYVPKDEEKIISILSDRLPFEPHTPDAVERLMQRIRF